MGPRKGPPWPCQRARMEALSWSLLVGSGFKCHVEWKMVSSDHQSVA
jgi:hypothetical protein